VLVLVPDRDDAVHHALEGDRRLLDARRPDHLARCLLESERLELINRGVELGRRAVASSPLASMII
jgi:hypothetical protein